MDRDTAIGMSVTLSRADTGTTTGTTITAITDQGDTRASTISPHHQFKLVTIRAGPAKKAGMSRLGFILRAVPRHWNSFAAALAL